MIPRFELHLSDLAFVLFCIEQEWLGILGYFKDIGLTLLKTKELKV